MRCLAGVRLQGVIILCGEGDEAFCSGGDQSLRGEGGYDDGTEEAPRLSVLDLQVRASSGGLGWRERVGGMPACGGEVVIHVSVLSVGC